MATDSSETNSLKAKDFVMLIKACKDAVVSVFEYGNLKISFKAPENLNLKKEDELLSNPTLEGGPVPLVIDQEEKLMELQLNSPAEFEEELRKLSGED